MLKCDLTYRKMYSDACMGNEEAVEFLLRLGRLCVVWDDVWDQTDLHTKEELDECFADAMFGFNSNRFYLTYKQILDPMIFLSWNAWKDANEWKINYNVMGELSSYTKELCNEIIILCAYLIGGVKNARRVSLKIRQFFLLKEEDYV